MTCDATWILASAQSTRVPFIQILPVPLKAINRLRSGLQPPQFYHLGLRGPRSNSECAHFRRKAEATGESLVFVVYSWLPALAGSTLLFLPTKRAAVRPGVQGFAALPAEPGGRRLAAAHPGLHGLPLFARPGLRRLAAARGSIRSTP